ncbi:hypothetical protein [Rheinheimera baltica]|uniref:hypothetical protein n=1 Tax=Rheinheimera baltica TaxID=67576 RepID=UPI0004131EBC|nr:hypothetical protein [Rheinheimera baltica]
MRKRQHNNNDKSLPWFGLAFLSVFMLAGIAGGVAFFRDGQPGAGLMFMAMFCGISALMMFLLLYGHKQALVEQAMLQGEAPPEGIASNSKTGYLTMLALGALFLAIGAPISYMAITDELPKANYAVLLVLVFPLAGALLMWQGRNKLKQWQKIGKTPFFADPFPGNAGGQVGGYFTLQHGSFEQLPQARLSCLHVYQSGSGKNRTTQRDSLWSAECEVSRTVDGKFWLALNVPGHLPTSGEDARYSGRIEWQLSCKGELTLNKEPLEFSRQWTLPVTAGNRRCSWQPHASEVALQQQRRTAEGFNNAARQILQQVEGNTLHLTSQPGRHTGTASTLIIVGAIFSGAGVFLSYKALEETAMLWLMALIFTPLGLLTLLFGLFWLGRGLKASVSPGQVWMQRSMFGIQLYQRQAQLTTEQQLSIKQTLSSTSGEGKRTEYFRLQADIDGKTLVLAEGITGRDAAEALKLQVAEALIR